MLSTKYYNYILYLLLLVIMILTACNHTQIQDSEPQLKAKTITEISDDKNIFILPLGNGHP